MIQNQDEKDYYIIPHNYQDNGKIWGLVDKKSFAVGTAWAVIIALSLWFLSSVNLITRIIIFVIIGIFPAAVIFVGIGHDTVFDYLKYYLQFKKSAKIYKYQKQGSDIFMEANKWDSSLSEVKNQKP